MFKKNNDDFKLCCDCIFYYSSIKKSPCKKCGNIFSNHPKMKNRYISKENLEIALGVIGLLGFLALLCIGIPLLV